MWLVKQPSQVGGDGAWKQEGLCKFKASKVYKMDSRTARIITVKLCLKKPKQANKPSLLLTSKA